MLKLNHVRVLPASGLAEAFAGLLSCGPKPPSRGHGFTGSRQHAWPSSSVHSGVSVPRRQRAIRAATGTRGAARRARHKGLVTLAIVEALARGAGIIVQTTSK